MTERRTYILTEGSNAGNAIYSTEEEINFVKKYEVFLSRKPKVLSLDERGLPIYSDEDKAWIENDIELLDYMTRLGVDTDDGTILRKEVNSGRRKKH